jgi:sugar/nucleoside kinase (ribokinase family)
MIAPPELVLVGNLLVDDIVLAGGGTLLGEPGGAVLHAALAASLWNCRTGIVSVTGSDYPQAALDTLAARDVDLSGIRPLGKPGGRAWLLHEPSARRVIHHLDSPAHADVSPTPADIPTGWTTARGIHLAPMPLACQIELAQSLGDGPERPFISLDPFELLLDETIERWREPLGLVDGFFAGEDDLRLSGDEQAIVQDLAGDRLRLLVLKRAAQGGSLVDLHTGQKHGWLPRVDGVVDVTGAGDAFAGGFLAGWLGVGDLAQGIAQGVVSASFALEDWGSRGLARATPQEARGRLADWFPELVSAGLGQGAAR